MDENNKDGAADNQGDAADQVLDDLNNSDLMLDNGDSPLLDLTGAKQEGAKDEDVNDDSKADDAGGKTGDDVSSTGDADDKDDGGGDSKDESVSDAGGDDDATATPPAKSEQKTKPAEPAAQLEDPGEFKPKDYSFKVEYKDGDETKELLVEKPEDIQKLPKEADFGTAANFVKFQSDYSRMVQKTEADKAAHEKTKADYDTQKTDREAYDTQLSNWEAELNFLRAQGKLPKLTKEQLTTNWRDPENLKNENIKAHVDLVDYMSAENKKLVDANLPPMGFREAYTQRENERILEAIADRKKKSEDTRKAAGAKVGGATNNSVPVSSHPDMIVGSGGSIYG